MWEKLAFAVWIRVLMLYRPVALFTAINQLDWYQQSLRRWVQGHELASGARILEAGCATGTLSEYLAASGYEVSAVDASAGMIAAATKDPHVAEYRVAEVGSLPYANASYDAIICASLINIVDDPQAALREMTRVCKPGGVISVLVPAQGFSDTDLHQLMTTLNLTGFSRAAMRAWHRLAPKMDARAVEYLLL